MQYKQLTVGRSEHLTLFFMGWGFCPAAMRLVWLPDSTAVVWDYRDMTLDLDAIHHWQVVDVIAWSEGIWAAEECMRLYPEIKWGRLTAVGGTPVPTDEKLGMGMETARRLAQEWDDAGRERFYRVMCGDDEAYDKATQFFSERTLQDQRDELMSILGRAAAAPDARHFVWDHAIVGSQDKVYPYEAQRDYWLSMARSIVIAEMPHWPFDHMHTIIH